MPDSIETTIFKLELDGSAYIAGADKLAASTTKLADAQTKANTKLVELQKTHNTYKKNLAEITAVLQANEKETIDLTKQLNALRDSEKGASAEATRLKTALRDITVNTKEFKNEAKELSANLANTTNQIKLQAKEVKAAEGASAGFTAGLSKVYGGLSKIANLIPGVGIGTLITGIAGAVIQLAMAETRFEQITKLLNEGLRASAGAAAGASGEVDILKLKFELARQGIINKKDVLEEYNNTIGKTLGVTKDFNEAEQTLIENAEAYIKIIGLKAQAQAIANQKIKESEKAVMADLEDNRSFLTKAAAVTSLWNPLGDNKAYFDAVERDKKRFATNTRVDANEKVRILTKEEIRVQTELALAMSQFKDRPKSFEKGTQRNNAEIVNIYQTELEKLQAELAKLDQKGFTDEASILRAIEADFKKRESALKKALNKGQLTEIEFLDLKDYLARVRKLITDQSIKDFTEQRVKLLNQIASQIAATEGEANLKRIANIQDAFERQRQTILAESDKLIKAKQESVKREIAAIEKDNKLTPAEIQTAISKTNAAMDLFVQQVKIHTSQKLQQLSFDTFEKLTEDARRLLDSSNLGVSQGSLVNIQEQTKLLQSGKISYQQYQKELTEIAKFEARERFLNEKRFLEAEIQIREEKLSLNVSLTPDQRKRLEDEIRRLKQQLIDAEKAAAIASGGKGPEDDKLQRVAQYAQAIGNLTSNIIKFWQATNEAEAAALDRSISLQEKRVSAAQKIAERGNAQYLKQEEDRLKEMQVKRENAARKQLGINAALQGSEILVALISGIAQGVKLGGPLGAIAALASIAAAVAGAFAIAESLKPPEQTFFTGTKDTGRGGNRDSKGGFTATLHPNEAVIPADRNKAYKPAISAIYDRTIPAEHLNAFVKNYHQIKSVPMPDYGRIKESAELSIGQDGRMHLAINDQNKLIMENNDLQRATLKALKTIGVNVSMDKNGFAMSIMEVAEQIKINTRV